MTEKNVSDAEQPEKPVDQEVPKGAEGAAEAAAEEVKASAKMLAAEEGAPEAAERVRAALKARLAEVLSEENPPEGDVLRFQLVLDMLPPSDDPKGPAYTRKPFKLRREGKDRLLQMKDLLSSHDPKTVELKMRALWHGELDGDVGITRRLNESGDIVLSKIDLRDIDGFRETFGPLKKLKQEEGVADWVVIPADQADAVKNLLAEVIKDLGYNIASDNKLYSAILSVKNRTMVGGRGGRMASAYHDAILRERQTLTGKDPSEPMTEEDEDILGIW